MIFDLIYITGLIWLQLLQPFFVFVAAWAVLIVAMGVIATIVGLVTHAIDDPESAPPSAKGATE